MSRRPTTSKGDSGRYFGVEKKKNVHRGSSVQCSAVGKVDMYGIATESKSSSTENRLFGSKSLS